MKEIIGKELLSEVLGKEVISSKKNEIGMLFIRTKGESHMFGESEDNFNINLDTLTRLCKEWCIKQGYLPAVTFNEDLTIWMILHNTNGGEVYSSDYRDTIELEAVIKATQWILEQTNCTKQNT